ncbi:TonB family protein [Arcobacter nitrofigilis DSM 7299]|uniref:TonB family protein n=1 Tax=Arcobacter nitrofigilis (strain ATCC 33309 / DSM 7299 / CCUG 15893 / LMG 7604 / NCTC 12251 / CI) TaxID=572480 RepID=D5V1S4_ARCNC|nr:energy transducer TonB [Arcobacter nitrofigilis]ADG93508.1 TonB family protein [Arcobacter nitrofigilis DSM 7299]
MLNFKRYFYSFFLTSFLYGLVFTGVLYSYDSLVIKNKIKEKTINLNFVSLVEQEKIVKKEPFVKQEPPKKEVEQKKISKKIIKKKVLKKQTIKKVDKKKIITKKPEKKVKEVVKKEQEFIQKSVKKTYEQDFLNENLKKIVILIQKNIKYPKRAKRLNIQGKVMVKFKILTNGEIREIESISGHSLLIKSSIEAIEKASKEFPKVKKEIVIKVPIQYTLT